MAGSCRNGVIGFLSTLSLRRATRPCFSRSFLSNFYPRSPCGERPRYFSMPSWNTSDFYPRSPCGERQKSRRFWALHPVFLSTLSLRRATCNRLHPSPAGIHFYPRSPCGERPQKRYHGSPAADFYPRSPCGERPWQLGLAGLCLHFYPRSPCGERLPDVSIFNLGGQFLSTLSLRRATTAKM